MPEFRGKVCWDPATAANTIGVEAISPSPAVFRATHAPLRIQRARLDGRQLVREGRPVDERAVLDDFLNHESNTGALLMPIVGESGSGKSHLVRWVREHLDLVDDQPASREVIYLEKHRTSLKAVVQSLIAQADSDELKQLKAEIDKFTADIDASVLARRLIHSLNETLVAETGRGVSGPARQLFGPQGLGALLDDPHVSEFMLRPEKFVPQLATYLLRDRTKGEGDRPPKFTVHDLPLDITGVSKASALAKKWVQVLSSKAELQEIAIDLLNEHLETAINRSFNLGMGRLLEAMTLVREEYHRQGKEIILLIEDFALIQGVQKDLLDAIVEAAHRDGSTRLAPIRTLMAVTTGYFRDLPETALTRVRANLGYAYDLDVPFSEEDTGEEAIAAFVGRYLNAARIGKDRLEQTGDAEPTNACDECPLQARCHDAFGASPDGYGLYPFNRSALTRAVHSTASKDEPWAFVPRTVLGSVVRPVLIQHASSLRRGEFPDSSFSERFPTAEIDQPLSTAVQQLVERGDPVAADRRKRVLEFWEDAAARGIEIDPAVLEAFALSPMAAESPMLSEQPRRAAEPSRQSSTSSSTAKTEDKTYPPSVQRSLQNIEEWVTRGDDLKQDHARTIRTVVATAVAQRYRWNTPLMQAQASVKDKGWPNNATVVSIEGSAVAGISGADSAPIQFKRSATNSRFFQSLIRAQYGLDQVRGEDVRRLATVAEEYSRALATRVQRNLEVTDDDLVVGLRASLLGAVLAGRAWPGMSIEELLAAAVDDGESWKGAGTMSRPERWTVALNQHLAARGALVKRICTGVGISQGSRGAVGMIDAARAVPLLAQAAANWSWETPVSTVPEWIKPAVKPFASWPALIEGQITMLNDLLRDIRLRQPRSTPGKNTLASIKSAVDRAREVSLSLSTQRARDLDLLLEQASAVEWSTISALEDELGRCHDDNRPEATLLTARIHTAAQDRGSSIEVVRNLLYVADEWLDEALKGAEMRASSSAAKSAADGVQELVAEWRSLVAEGVDGQ
ncbi:protein DpdH [Streptomyces sp. H39-C1]|uniref:protein DpdH n=1 Tax=Streptomyces sp. H39-C1 TaxID=3004355 RepID=UPI0022B01A24|nr:protein DpdH [Streptomyces sp. H39-C1]MCZ4100791.1 protein DpdH [Streptomyces sp. H39-C1]